MRAVFNITRETRVETGQRVDHYRHQCQHEADQDLRRIAQRALDTLANSAAMPNGRSRPSGFGI